MTPPLLSVSRAADLSESAALGHIWPRCGPMHISQHSGQSLGSPLLIHLCCVSSSLQLHVAHFHSSTPHTNDFTDSSHTYVCIPFDYFLVNKLLSLSNMPVCLPFWSQSKSLSAVFVEVSALRVPSGLQM